MYSFLTKYNVLFNRQFRFRNNHSTNHALVSFMELVKKYLDNYYFVVDVIDHSLIYKKHLILSITTFFLQRLSIIVSVLKLLVQWLRSNKFSLNEAKTELIIFRSLCNFPVTLTLELITISLNSINSPNTLVSLLIRFCLEINKLTTYSPK